MEQKIIIVLAMLATVCFAACTYNNEEELFTERPCDTTPATYAADIAPIIQLNCAISGCHVANRQFPNLSDYAGVQQHAARIKIRTANGTMPPSSSGKNLTVRQINQISCWVDGGALNN